MIGFLKATFINDLPDDIYINAINANDTTLHSECEQASWYMATTRVEF